MATRTPEKKASTFGGDWHPADIKAALAKAGWSMRQLGLANGVSRQCVSRALAGPYPKSERMIAAAIGLRPEGIWPSRYNADGTPNRSRGRQPMRPVNGKPSTPRGARNTHSSRAA